MHILSENIREVATMTNKLGLYRVHVTSASILQYNYGIRTCAITAKKLDSHKKDASMAHLKTWLILSSFLGFETVLSEVDLGLLRLKLGGNQLHSVWNLAELKCRSSRPEVFSKKAVLRNFTKFTGKHLCQVLFFNKVAGLFTEHLLWLLLTYCLPMI